MNHSDIPASRSDDLASWFTQFCELNKTNMHDDNPMQEALYRQLSQLSDSDLHARSSEIIRLMRSNGFIDGSYSGQWQLDPIPHLLDSSTWQRIEQGIEQRVHLLNGILGDLVSEQNLLLNNRINGKQLFAHPQYMGESDYRQFPASLFLVAMDIGITEDNQFYALQDHCQFPRGLGLLLENRIISRRVMSDEFRQCGVERVANFFQQVNRAISAQTQHAPDARVVILTKGPIDQYYSEQVYLATYLGYTLVKSSDLTVRKGSLWLKALNGLKKVDVVLRWIEDSKLDSLEQSEYSVYGIPGLLHAIRSGNVTLLNNYGSGLLQIPAIQNRLGALSESLHGQSLIIQQPQSLPLSQVDLSKLDNVELRSYTAPDLRLDGAVSPEQIRETVSKQDSANLFFRQKVNLKQVPFWYQNNLVKMPVVFRCFALCHQGKTTVLPSALCITVGGKRRGSGIQIKDTWVACVNPETVNEEKLSLPKVTQKAGDMALMEGYIPSRTAENLYSLGTSIERTENICRLLRVFFDRYTEWTMYPNYLATNALERLAQGIFEQRLIAPFNNDTTSTKESEESLLSKQLGYQAMTQKALHGSLYNTLSSVCTMARNVRELLSYDSQRILENLETEWRKLERMPPNASIHIMQSAIDRIVSLIMAFRGSLADSLSNATGDFMFDLGIRYERLQCLLGSLETMLGEALPGEDQRYALDILLTSQVSSVTHRRRYRMHQSVSTGIELLVLAYDYPRSIAFQIDQLITLSNFLPDKPRIGSLASLDKLLLKFKADCHLSDAKVLASTEGGSRKSLLSLITLLRGDLKHFSDLLNTRFFTHTKVANKRPWAIMPTSSEDGSASTDNLQVAPK